MRLVTPTDPRELPDRTSRYLRSNIPSLELVSSPGDGITARVVRKDEGKVLSSALEAAGRELRRTPKEALGLPSWPAALRRIRAWMEP
ncbi:MAG: hypothetical protein AVDCRST_MAG93-7723 [uncultured Chloroflexia bacterium]|uniref:Uncharacterized protein n=1 Tax=uncultured Chloroflexia bacterium TaxID=1672391 RepID=A0A6J4MKS0_9CHLR|nr:MAG: hypothetical protein AVDCRST_MAG93-7723 [uncultured Chloroflexia bacterium]